MKEFVMLGGAATLIGVLAHRAQSTHRGVHEPVRQKCEFAAANLKIAISRVDRAAEQVEVALEAFNASDVFRL
jgi:hypothetical protein